MKKAVDINDNKVEKLITIGSGPKALEEYVKALHERYPHQIIMITPTLATTLSQQSALITVALKAPRPQPIGRLQLYRCVEYNDKSSSIASHINTLTNHLMDCTYNRRRHTNPIGIDTTITTPTVVPTVSTDDDDEVERDYHILHNDEFESVEKVTWPPCCHGYISDVVVPTPPSVVAALTALVGEYAYHGGELCHEPNQWHMPGTHTWTGYLYPPHLPLFDQYDDATTKGDDDNDDGNDDGRNHKRSQSRARIPPRRPRRRPTQLRNSKKLRAAFSKVDPLPVSAAPVYANKDHCESHHMRSINIAMNDLVTFKQNDNNRCEVFGEAGDVVGMQERKETIPLDELARVAHQLESKSSSSKPLSSSVPSVSSTSSTTSLSPTAAISLVWQVLEEEANMKRAATIYHKKASQLSTDAVDHQQTDWNLYGTISLATVSWEEFIKGGVIVLLAMQYPGDTVITYGHHRFDNRIGKAAYAINVASWSTELDNILAVDRQHLRFETKAQITKEQTKQQNISRDIWRPAACYRPAISVMNLIEAALNDKCNDIDSHTVLILRLLSHRYRQHGRVDATTNHFIRTKKEQQRVLTLLQRVEDRLKDDIRSL
jgi:hypothetical protein